MTTTSSHTAVAGYARAAGACALIAAALAVVIPDTGVLWFSPLAVILGIIAIKGGAKGYAIGVILIVAVNMILSPRFLLNIGAGFTIPGATATQIVTYIGVFGVLGMILMLLSSRVWTSIAAVVIGLIGMGIYGQLRKPKMNPLDHGAAAPQAPSPLTTGARIDSRAAVTGAQASVHRVESPPTTLRQAGNYCDVFGCGDNGRDQHVLIARTTPLYDAPDSQSHVSGYVQPGATATYADSAAIVTVTPQVYQVLESVRVDEEPFEAGQTIYAYGMMESGRCYRLVWTRGSLYGDYPSPRAGASVPSCKALPLRMRVVTPGHIQFWYQVKSATGVGGWLLSDEPQTQWSTRLPDVSGTWGNDEGVCLDIRQPRDDRTIAVSMRDCSGNPNRPSQWMTLQRTGQLHYSDPMAELWASRLDVAADTVTFSPPAYIAPNDLNGWSRTFTRAMVTSRPTRPSPLATLAATSLVPSADPTPFTLSVSASSSTAGFKQNGHSAVVPKGAHVMLTWTVTPPAARPACWGGSSESGFPRMGWYGLQGPFGVVSYSISTTATYVMRCASVGGNASDSVALTVVDH